MENLLNIIKVENSLKRNEQVLKATDLQVNSYRNECSSGLKGDLFFYKGVPLGAVTSFVNAV